MIKVEIADSPTKRELGLMGRKNMGQNNGMFFVFESNKHLSFWGEKTYIPLDIAFINDKNKIVAIKEIVPLSTKAVSCDIPCKFALEANLNYFQNNKIKVGDSIEIKENIITFIKKEENENNSSKK